MSIKIDEACRYAICPETGLPIREGDRCAYDEKKDEFFHRKSRAYADALLEENCKMFGI